MILLVSTTDRIQLTASGTTDLDIHASYVDENAGTYTPGRKNTNITSTSATDIVSAPGSGVDRTVKTIAIRNTHANSVTVTIEHRDGASVTVELHKVALATGEALHYDEHRGWRVIDVRGRIKVSRALGDVTSGGSDFGMQELTADQTNNNGLANTAQDVSADLSFSYDASSTTTVIWFRFFTMYTSAATTTGSRWMLRRDAAGSDLRMRADYSFTTTSRTSIDGTSADDTPSASNTTSAATAANISVVEGFINCNGGAFTETAYLRFASEVASSAVVAKIGSILHLYTTIA